MKKKINEYIRKVCVCVGGGGGGGGLFGSMFVAQSDFTLILDDNWNISDA